MLVIRLQRTGRKNSPAYRIVVTEKRNPAKSRFLEVLGHYLPSREPILVDLKQERITHWMGMGAIPSDTVARLLIKNGMKGLEKYTMSYTKKRSKSAPPEEPAKPAPKAESPAPVAEEVVQGEPKPQDAPADAGDSVAKEA